MLRPRGGEEALVGTSVGETQPEAAQSEASVAEELVGRARALAPFLAERAPETAELRQVAPDVVSALASEGLMNVGAPAAFGGRAIDIDTMFEIAYELGRGCASTAWCWSLWQTHAWFMGWASSDAQNDFFERGPTALMSSGVKPGGAVLTPVEGGCMLSGRWGFSSGVDYADWVLFGGYPPGSAGPPDLGILMLVPREQVRIEDDWFVIGLRGTGSKTVAIDEPVFVPEYRFLLLNGAETGPAKEVFGRASYALPVQMPVHYVVAAPLLGAARAAVDTVVDQMSTRRHSFTKSSKADSVNVQTRIAKAAAEVDAALAMARSDLRELLSLGEQNGVMTPEERARCRLHHAYVVLLARQATTRLFEIAGTAGMFKDAPMQRFFSDVYAGSQHIALLWDETAESYGRVRLGLEATAMFR
jgi:alkylation response protein AidB-like acyl-CoA dehydrogenase